MVNRKRFRFSLKTLLCAVLLTSLPLTWLSLELARSREQARAVSRLRSLGATIYYDFHHYYDQNGEGCLNESREPDDWIYPRKWFGNDLFSDVYYVQFIGLTWIPQRPGITHYFGPVDTPNPLSRAADKHVYLLQSLRGLHTLDLHGSMVTDKAIPILAELKSLKLLHLSDTSVTQDGATHLEKLLPDCEIYWR